MKFIDPAPLPALAKPLTFCWSAKTEGYGMLAGRKVLLIIGGGIAAYRSLELIRRLRERGAGVTPVLTRGGSEFITPLSVSALAAQKVHTGLFDVTSEAEIGHIELSRSCDLIVVAPATADFLAKMACGLASDLASTLLLATDKKVLVAPSMNLRMWLHPATQRSIATLKADGILFAGPIEGSMACGDFGIGRMAEPTDIVTSIESALQNGPLQGRHILVTSGPTHEPIDPVRYLANRSSGAQGTAIAEALAALGATVTFVTGPATTARPRGVKVTEVETAAQMAAAVTAALPADAAIFAAAVADWRVANASTSKLKKSANGGAPVLSFAENPDILQAIAQLKSGRPRLVIGFAAETDDVLANAKTKRARKGCDWIVANDVSAETGIMGGPDNAVTLITASATDVWPRMSKTMVAAKLAARIADALK